MAGGGGTRLWPLSTPDAPKPFRRLRGERTLFQDTALRTLGDAEGIGFTAPIVICGRAHQALAEGQLAEVGVTPALIVLEPFGRGTAAVAALAAELTDRLFPRAFCLLSPADHHVSDVDAFRRVVATAATVADGRIVTFGILPERPEIGYGYIQAGEEIAPGVRAIARFVEKPSLATAEAYLADGGYLWNSGLFLFAPRVMREEMRALQPGLADAVKRVLAEATTAGAVMSLGDEAFAACPSDSLDYAVAEKTTRAAMAPADIGWADVGSWNEVLRLNAPDADGNVVHGPADVSDSRNTLAWSDGPPVVVSGVSGVSVVATAEGVLVTSHAQAQQVGRLVEAARRRFAVRPPSTSR